MPDPRIERHPSAMLKPALNASHQEATDYELIRCEATASSEDELRLMNLNHQISLSQVL